MSTVVALFACVMLPAKKIEDVPPVTANDVSPESVIEELVSMPMLASPPLMTRPRPVGVVISKFSA